ncbi:MAG: ABC transporter permease, partial [Burkholderiaceae bacterium]
MSQYILRRLLIAIPSLLGISLALFTVLALAPGDPFGELAANPNVPPEVAAELRRKFGMDDPVLVRYWSWFTAMLQGSWGFSFVSRMDVDQLILQRLPTTLVVIGSSQLLALAIALPVGIYSATKPYSIFDQIANTLAFIGFSLPTFFTGILLTLIFLIAKKNNVKKQLIDLIKKPLILLSVCISTPISILLTFSSNQNSWYLAPIF